jgi:hypothetical protein
MGIEELNSNTVKTISLTLIESMAVLSKSKNLDQFKDNYEFYSEAWKDWNILLSLLETHKEHEYKGYAYSIISKTKVTDKINAVSFDPKIKTLDAFYEKQIKSTNFFPFSPNEIIAWDEDYFIINDFLNPSLVVLNRVDKEKI